MVLIIVVVVVIDQQEEEEDSSASSKSAQIPSQTLHDNTHREHFDDYTFGKHLLAHAHGFDADKRPCLCFHPSTQPFFFNEREVVLCSDYSGGGGIPGNLTLLDLAKETKKIIFLANCRHCKAWKSSLFLWWGRGGGWCLSAQRARVGFNMCVRYARDLKRVFRTGSQSRGHCNGSCATESTHCSGPAPRSLRHRGQHSRGLNRS